MRMAPQTRWEVSFTSQIHDDGRLPQDTAISNYFKKYRNHTYKLYKKEIMELKNQVRREIK